MAYHRTAFPARSRTRSMASRYVFPLVLLLTLPLVAGCGAIFGSRYGDFRAYYNTFYNAERDFEREERALLRQDPPIDRTRYLALFYAPSEGRTPRPGLESAILRSADVLRDHPESRWVDNALLLIGKSYFYQGNADPAAQKFREVMALPETRLRDEAALWLGRSLMEAQDYAAAADELRAALDRPDLRPRQRAPLLLLLAEVDVRRGDFEPAAEALEAGLDADPDGVLESRAAFLLGQVYDTLERYDDAARAYTAALEARPSPELTYAATLQRGLALARSGEHERGLSALARLARDDRFFTQRGEVEMVRARALAYAGQSVEARALLRRLLYDRDSGLRIDAIRGQVHYQLGRVYRDNLRDYARAAAHFDTAATQVRPPTTRSLLTPEALRNIDATASAFGDYARVERRVSEIDSLLYLGSLDDVAFAAAIEEVREQRRREAEQVARERRRLEEQQGFGMGAGAPVAGAPTGNAAEAGSTSRGFLDFRDPIRVQENAIAFQTRWGDRPYVPNWRRAEAVSAELALRDAADEDRDSASSAPTLAAIGDVFVDVSAVPRTPEARRTLAAERAVARYEMGNVLFLALGEPESAADWYRLVIEEDADDPAAPRAYYALAEVERALGHDDRADALLAELRERYPDTPLARPAAERLGLDLPEPEPDEAARDEAAYAAAFEAWQQRRYGRALRGMMALTESTSSVAPRARLAAGLIYTEWAAGDTGTLLAASPDPLLLPDPFIDPDEAFGPDALDHMTQESLAMTATPTLAMPSLTMPALDEPAVADALLADPEAAAEPADAPADEPVAVAPAPPTQALTPLETVLATPIGVPMPEDEPVEPEGVEPDAPQPVWLETLYASLEADFPGSPYADRARLLREAIEERRLALEARLAAEAAALDPVAAEPTAEPVDDGPGFDEAALRGDAPLQPEAEGFTWVLLRSIREFEAQNRLVSFANRGYRVMLATEQTESGEAFVVLCGQFPSEAEALAAEIALPIGRDAQVLAVRPFGDFRNFRSVADLLGTSD